MTYLVFCTFDLKAASAADYQNAYSDLAGLGLNRVAKSAGGSDVVIPTTAAMGTYTGSSAASVRDHVSVSVKNAFAARGFRSEIFIVVGGDWAWVGNTT